MSDERVFECAWMRILVLGIGRCSELLVLLCIHTRPLRRFIGVCILLISSSMTLYAYVG